VVVFSAGVVNTGPLKITLSSAALAYQLKVTPGVTELAVSVAMPPAQMEVPFGVTSGVPGRTDMLTCTAVREVLAQPPEDTVSA
jgi:hypothetical protein